MKNEIICEDSIIRRLYSGNDFNNIGLDLKNKKRCNCRNKCGNNKIVILSGTGDEKVFDISDEDSNTTNFDLSKKDFVEKIVNDDNRNISYNNFSLIFDKIEEIINLK